MLAVGWYVLLPDEVRDRRRPQGGEWVREGRLVGGLDGLPLSEDQAVTLGHQVATWTGRVVQLVEAVVGGRQPQLVRTGREIGPGLLGEQEPLPPGIARLLELRGFARYSEADYWFDHRFAVVWCYTDPNVQCEIRRDGHCTVCLWTFTRKPPDR